MSLNILLLTPPFTQLNTPYPATLYLTGFLRSKGISADQCDLSIDLFNRIFTGNFIRLIFEEAGSGDRDSLQFQAVWEQREAYIDKVDRVRKYLQQQEVTAAYQLLRPGFLPLAHRSPYAIQTEEVDATTEMDLGIKEDTTLKSESDFQTEDPLEWAFGNLGILDKAKHLATLFIEELGDFIMANVDEFFSFTKYAEHIARSASSFDEIEQYLCYEPTLIEDQLLTLLAGKLEKYQPDLVCITIPFPGNLFAALRCGQYIKNHSAKTKIAFGGGFCNTELRSLSDPRVFNYVDFITLDDGEGPLLKLTEFLSGEIPQAQLERTFLLKNKKVFYQNKPPHTNFHHKDLPAPTYAGLDLKHYLSFLDVMNPMHRLWSDGRWNKLTVSHGCYWKQCSFCDVGLDYIGNYQNTTAEDLVDKIEVIIAETGSSGFHFVDEAAPPKILKALAEKLIERKVEITWWTNIRFEKTFSPELCALLARSGCIAVTGGLEVASDRLLSKMNKGVDIAQVARVTRAFADNDIMVHAYLMYGFPTQTEQETIDSLEVVRQLFENGCIQSAFWHLFTATVHSPIGLQPEKFGIKITGPKFRGFAQNDLEHEDPEGADHQAYGEALKLALSYYLNGEGLDVPLQEWFEMEVAETTLPGDLIEGYLT